MRALVNLSAAIAGLMLIIVGSLLSTGMLLPIPKYPFEIINLPITWQVPSLLLCSLLCGPRTGVITSIAYLTIGLFYLPIFQNGGNPTYLGEPGFGYLIGFIPAAWVSGRLSQQKGMNNLILISLAAFSGLILLHICGSLNLVIGHLMHRWNEPLPLLLFSYSIVPLTAQLALCPAVGLVAIILRRILFIK